MIVLVPAYEPDGRLVDLVRDLLATDPALHVLVVDDGSGPACRKVFDATAALGAVIYVPEIASVPWSGGGSIRPPGDRCTEI